MKRKDLVIVESERKAKRLTAILGDAVEIMTCPGHLRTLIHVALDEMGEYYCVPDDLAFVERSLEQAALRANRIILATEPDREGETAAWHIAETLPERVQDRIYRVLLPNLETDTVLDQVEDADQPININSVYAWRTRQMINWLIVNALTPLMQRWKLVPETSFDLDRTALAALHLLVRREWDRSTYAADQPWHVRVQLNANGRQFWADLEDDSLLHNEQEAYAMIDLLTQSETGWQVEKVTQRELTEKPYPPFTFSALLQDAAEQLWLSPGDVQAAARELYEAGLITYFRTNSTDVDRETIIVDRSVLDIAFGEHFSSDPAPGRLTDGDVGAIRPVDLGQDLLKVEGLSETARTIYNRIWLRYVASLLHPAQFAVQEIIVRPTWTGCIEAWEDKRTYPHPFVFRAELHERVEPGWQVIYPWPRGARESEAEQLLIPDLAEGDALTSERLTATQLNEHLDRYTAAGLLSTLEKRRLSRSHTLANAFEQLIEGGWATIEENQLAPTPKGEDLIFLCTTHFKEVLDLPFNVVLEHMLDQVAAGELAREQVLAAFARRFSPAADEAIRSIVEPAKGDLPTISIQRESA